MRWTILLGLASLSCGASPAPTPPAPAASTTGAAPLPSAPAPDGPVGKMAHVPEATFKMGSEAGEPDEMPVHSAHVAAFDIDLTEVTVAQYAKCATAGACVAAPGTAQWPGIGPEDAQDSRDMCNADKPDRQDHPENCVDWTMADTYCKWAGKRLPTEEEWEYAACAGNCNDALRGKAGRSISSGAARWAPGNHVASGAPGPFGVYDMAGSVWEWTASAYCAYDHPGCNDKRRVVRGGSWSVVDTLFVRLTDRSPSDPATRNAHVGFRCVKPAP